ncbi:MAG: TIR domain-containing protein [bacterium]|nr:TIR domain-containing protein [bacterium]
MYDIFLSHSGKDKVVVEALARSLKDHSITPFLDVWHLVPGRPFQEGLEDALATSSTIGICVGPEGLGFWETEEARAALDRRRTTADLRIIPIILPDTPVEIVDSMPPLLRRYTSVDLSGFPDDSAALQKLLAGIRGVTPEQQMGGRQPARLLIVLSGPSSVGKDVVLGRLMRRSLAKGYPCSLVKKVTTRPERREKTDTEYFDHVNSGEFRRRKKRGSVAAYIYVYGHYYGVDVDDLRRDSDSIRFVSLRSLAEVLELEEAARQIGYSMVKIFLNADVQSLKDRTLCRTMDKEDRQRRTEQILDDLGAIQANVEEYRERFDMIKDNGDHVAITDTVEAVWSRIRDAVKQHS